MSTTTTATTTPSKPITFYDIRMAPPIEKTLCSPNPWKTRLALNFKSLPYKTSWVALPDVAKVRTQLKVPAVRKFADGTDFYTLPIIEDPNFDATVGDSFDIAAYLQRTYPDSGAGDLFPKEIQLDYTLDGAAVPLMVPLSDVRESEFPSYAKFNVQVDAAFTAHVQLGIRCFPLDPETAEISKAEFVRRAGARSWDDFTLEGEARERTKESLRKTLGELGRLFERDGSGPFVLGEKACYADIIVDAWLRMFQACLPAEEWEEVRGWHGGIFGRLHDALDVYAEIK